MRARFWVRSTLALAGSAVAGTALAGMLLAPSFAPPGPSPRLPVQPAGQTIKDLKTAYRDETAGQAKYAAFALKARHEGYREAAALFQATAASERIQARNHRAVLLKLGVQPEAGFYHAQPGTTAENFWDAITREMYERDSVYPAMIQHATMEGQMDAARTFTYALSAAEQHVPLYRQAWEGLLGVPVVSVYYVAPGCGGTYAGTPPASCPNCGAPASRFARFE